MTDDIRTVDIISESLSISKPRHKRNFHTSKQQQFTRSSVSSSLKMECGSCNNDWNYDNVIPAPIMLVDTLNTAPETDACFTSLPVMVHLLR